MALALLTVVSAELAGDLSITPATFFRLVNRIERTVKRVMEHVRRNAVLSESLTRLEAQGLQNFRQRAKAGK